MPTNNEKILIFGASGHAKVVIDILERQGVYEIAFLVDDNPLLKGQGFFGYRVIGGKADLLTLGDTSIRAIVAVGSNSQRMKIATWLNENGFSLITAVHPSSQLGRGVVLGEGTVVMANVVINPDTQIGANVIINSKASVDHDCMVADGVHVAPGATLCGSVNIGIGTVIGAGSTVSPNITIGKDVMIGAGAVVVNDVSDQMTVVGVPARSLTV